MIKDRFISITYGLSSLLIVISTLVAALGIPFGRGAIIIRFDNYHNEVIWSGNAGILFGIIGIIVVVTVLNAWLSFQIYEKERFLSQILGAGTLVINLLFLIAVFAISLIN